MIVEKEALLSQREQLIAEKEALLAERDRLIAVRDAELYSKTLQIEHLKAQLAVLRRARFGRSSEKLDRDIEQLELLIGELEEGVAENKIRAEQAEDKARVISTRTTPTNRQPGGRKPLPAHLPRERIVHEPAPACACCGSTVLRKLGEDVTELLEYVASSFKVIQLVRPKLSCRACETIVQAPLPSLPIERGRPGPGLLAHVAVAKYADGLPLYRQSAIYAREGIDLDRSTLADWVGRMAALLDPLVQAIGRHVRAGPVLHADDTTVEVLAPGQGRTRIGRLWAVVRDERAFGGAAAPAAFYRYSPDRRAEHTEALLGSCRDSCTPTAMLASTACLRTIRRVASRASAKSHAGRTRAATSMRSTNPPPRRWRRKRWSALPNCLRSKRGSMAARRRNGWSCVSKRPCRCWLSLRAI